MAITTKQGLWELAATLMGQAASEVIVDATAPSTPVEVTLDSYYDTLRVALLRSVQPRFAVREKELRKAPTIKSNGDVQTWSERWDYVYQEPLDSLRFLGFRKDYSDLGFINRFTMRALPIQYKSGASTIGTPPIYTWAADAWGGSIWRGSIWASIVDEAFDEFELRDSALPGGSAFPNEFEWVDSLGSTPSSQTINPYDGGGVITLGSLAWWPYDWSTPTYPSTVTLNVAIYPTDLSNWTEHIFCDVPDAVGVYVVDETDPSIWTEEFQILVATELAMKAAVVHAKSSKIIANLREQLAIARSEVVKVDEETVGGETVSSAERARW